MSDQFLNLAGSDAAAAAWDRVVAAAPDAWLWSTRAMHTFRVTVLEGTGRLVGDRSFILVRDGKPCAVVPLTLLRERETGIVVAAYGDEEAFIPWPALAQDAANAETEALIFDEIERRVCDAGGGMLSLKLAPPGVGAELGERFAAIVRARTFVDVSYAAQYVAIAPGALDNVRERYRRNVRKFLPSYELAVIESDNIPEDFAATYMALHTKDTGKVFRAPATYERQADIARCNEAFWVTATSKAAGRIVGALQVGLYKKAAFDNSVAVDPDFAEEQVSHLLKWRAIEHLIAFGAKHYELGRAALTPSYLWQPTPKNYGITFFKDGWSRGRLKTVWAAEKYYSRALFDHFWDRRRAALHAHFGL